MDSNAPTPLTVLREDEQMFREAVATFATDEIAPRVHRMDHEQHLDPELVAKCFEMGLMGIEIPEQYGGSGGTSSRRVWRWKSWPWSILRCRSSWTCKTPS